MFFAIFGILKVFSFDGTLVIEQKANVLCPHTAQNSPLFKRFESALELELDEKYFIFFKI